MIHKITTTCTLLVTLVAAAQTAQKIGDNPTNLHQSAVMEIESSTRGFLPPRMTTVQRDLMPNRTIGLVIYNTTTQMLEVWDGQIWFGGKGGDNLGNHTATTNLNMANREITNILQMTINTKLNILDSSPVPNDKYFSIYKSDGAFKIWGVGINDAFSIDDRTGKTTLISATIQNGTDKLAPVKDYIATAANENGDIVWKAPPPIPQLVPVISNDAIIIPDKSIDDYFIVASAVPNLKSQISLPDNVRLGAKYIIRNTSNSSSLSVSNSSTILNMNGVQIKEALIPAGEVVTFCNFGYRQWYTNRTIPVNQ